MKLLLDENIGNLAGLELRKQGHDVTMVSEMKNRGLSDIEIFEFAGREDRAILTRDYHFSNPFNFPPKGRRGIIYLRHGNLTSGEESAIITRFFSSCPSDEYEGKFITVYKDKYTIR